MTFTYTSTSFLISAISSLIFDSKELVYPLTSALVVYPLNSAFVVLCSLIFFVGSSSNYGYALVETVTDFSRACYFSGTGSGSSGIATVGSSGIGTVGSSSCGINWSYPSCFGISAYLGLMGVSSCCYPYTLPDSGFCSTVSF